MKRRSDGPAPAPTRTRREEFVSRKRVANVQGGRDSKRTRITLDDYAKQMGSMLMAACTMRAALRTAATLYDGVELTLNAVFQEDGKGYVSVQGLAHEISFVLYPHTCGRAYEQLRERLVRTGPRR